MDGEDGKGHQPVLKMTTRETHRATTFRNVLHKENCLGFLSNESMWHHEIRTMLIAKDRVNTFL
jgi:hypothetical protein